MFHYKITEKTTECKVSLGYFISETLAPERVNPKAEINVYDPDNVQIRQLRFDAIKNGEAERANLTFNKVGKYTMIIENKSKYSMIVDYMLGL